MPVGEDEWSAATIAEMPAWTLVQAYHVIAGRFRAAFTEAGLGRPSSGCSERSPQIPRSARGNSPAGTWSVHRASES